MLADDLKQHKNDLVPEVTSQPFARVPRAAYVVTLVKECVPQVLVLHCWWGT